MTCIFSCKMEVCANVWNIDHGILSNTLFIEIYLFLNLCCYLKHKLGPDVDIYVICYHVLSRGLGRAVTGMDGLCIIQ